MSGRVETKSGLLFFGSCGRSVHCEVEIRDTERRLKVEDEWEHSGLVRPGISVLRLGNILDIAPFFLGCDLISDCFLTCSPNQPRWFCLAKDRILTFA